MTVGTFQDIVIRFPSITEKQRGFTITVLFDRLDKVLCLFRGPFPMMHRMHQPTARQDIDKRPAIAHVLSLAFVVAEPGFFLRYTTKIHQFDTGSNASHGSLIFIEVFKIYNLLNLLKLEKLVFVV